MRVRPVTSDDFDAIAALTNVYIRDTAIHFGETSVTAAELRDGWAASRERHPFLVAEDDDGTFLGYAKAGSWRTREAYRFTAEVGIYVEARAQRRGVGVTLYAALIEACRAKGFHVLIGGITMPNEPSVRLHERLGFERIGVFPEVGRKFDAWHAVGFWQLTLGR